LANDIKGDAQRDQQDHGWGQRGQLQEVGWG
jgi:hypothetical protein